MTIDSRTSSSSDSASTPGLAARLGSWFVWYAIPAVAVAGVVAYICLAIFWHANPPVVPVTGGSMRPSFQPGDLVVLRGVEARTLRKGDVVAVEVPKSARAKYTLPSHIVHRIVKIEHDSSGLLFTTKGDANAGPDVFQTPAANIVGKEVLDLPGFGYPFLFFRSRQGEIFLIAAVFVALVYFAIGVIDERRVSVESTAVTMTTLLEETKELKGAIAKAEQLVARSQRLAAPADDPRIEELAADIASLHDDTHATAQTMRELVGAISEYGEHLRSHTAVMQNLAATTAELHGATAGLRAAVADPLRTTPVAPLTAFELPLSVPADLMAQRAALSRRSAQVDELLESLSMGGRPGQAGRASR